MLDYEFFNPNPRGSITSDCVKRAIVVATGIDYHELEVDMNRKKKVKSEPYNNSVNWMPYIENVLNGKVIKMSVPAGSARWHVNTIGIVMNKYPHISYVLQVSKHLIGVKNKTIYDLFDDRRRNKGIYKMWIFGATLHEISAIQEEIKKGGYFEL